MIETFLNQVICALRVYLETASEEERLRIFVDIERGYCGHCGAEDPDGDCRCQDES